jgi:hypothetical protein
MKLKLIEMQITESEEKKNFFKQNKTLLPFK